MRCRKASCYASTSEMFADGRCSGDEIVQAALRLLSTVDPSKFVLVCVAYSLKCCVVEQNFGGSDELLQSPASGKPFAPLECLT